MKRPIFSVAAQDVVARGRPGISDQEVSFTLQQSLCILQAPEWHQTLPAATHYSQTLCYGGQTALIDSYLFLKDVDEKHLKFALQVKGFQLAHCKYSVKLNSTAATSLCVVVVVFRQLQGMLRTATLLLDTNVCTANTYLYLRRIEKGNNVEHLSAQWSMVPCVTPQVFGAELQLLLQLFFKGLHLFPSTKHLQL